MIRSDVKAALIVPRLVLDAGANMKTILDMAGEAVAAGAKLVLFPEAAVTGLINNDDPIHDLPLGQEIPGPVTGTLGGFCRQHAVWLGIGMLEREEQCLYDAAVLIDPGGSVTLKYRRNHPHWHARSADPDVYRQGTEIPKAATGFGSVSFLICGDLFDDDIVSRTAALRPDMVLYLLARSFEEEDCDQDRWDSQEMQDYIERIIMIGSPALIVNYLADPSLAGDFNFGGAWVVSKEGDVIGSFPLGKEGTLMIDLERLR